MLSEVKTALRITGDSQDDDIRLNIRAALLDMGRVGMNVSGVDTEDSETYDALILSCVTFYLKWIYNFLTRGEEWHKAYITLRDSMARCGDYR